MGLLELLTADSTSRTLSRRETLNATGSLCQVLKWEGLEGERRERKTERESTLYNAMGVFFVGGGFKTGQLSLS